MIDILKAILAINPTAKCSTSNEDIDNIRWDEGQTPISKEDIQAKQTELQAEYDAQEYARNRATAYASTGDQLDMQYWDSVNDTTTWKDHVASVKAQFPKV
jgi:hypothetical protein